eukprot:GILJ01001636.1.p1 GENE.GILJ01001636.1~~GILJ01001636.1.p1  ORF type:complete len:193 (+),score=22.17 GILJ01001636.1:46-579(+)
MVSVEVSPDFGWVIVGASSIALHCFLQGFPIGGLRRKFFDEKFLSKWADQHKKHFGTAPAKGGYPDMGNGIYSQQLPYDQWVIFNNAQRAHHNYLEGVTSMITWVILGGLFCPRLAAGASALYIVGRQLFATAYRTKGPGARLAGGLLCHVAELMVLLPAVYHGVKLTGFLDKYLGK